MDYEADAQREDTQRGRFLTLSLSQEIFALEIGYVTEIVGIQPITPVPEVPDYARGIINLRGKIIPVVDMRLRFKKPEAEYTDRTCIVVVDMEDISVGLIVDTVLEVITIPDEHIVPPPDTRTGIQNHYIKGIASIDKQVILLLDCLKLFSPGSLEDLSGISIDKELPQ